jgi:asparagine synthetase B (glutamine-hydrolysing)
MQSSDPPIILNSGGLDSTTCLAIAKHELFSPMYSLSCDRSEGQRAARMKLLFESPKCPVVSRYDYVSAPPLRNLLNRFSTPLAIKLAGASQPSDVSTKGSVLFFLPGVVWPRQM